MSSCVLQYLVIYAVDLPLDIPYSTILPYITKDMLLNSDTIKSFLSKIGERYSFIRKLESQVEKKISTESSVNKVMETIMADENELSIYPRPTLQCIR